MAARRLEVIQEEEFRGQEEVVVSPGGCGGGSEQNVLSLRPKKITYHKFSYLEEVLEVKDGISGTWSLEKWSYKSSTAYTAFERVKFLTAKGRGKASSKKIEKLVVEG